MITLLITTHIIQPHPVICRTALRLEEHCRALTAPRAGVVLGTGEGGVGDDVTHYRLQLVDLVSDLVDVDAVVVRPLGVLAVLALVHETLVDLVLLGIQHVVALRTELDADELGTIRGGGGRGWGDNCHR